VPYITDSVSFQVGGPDDYSAIQRRGDILVYSTASLAADTEVTGPIHLTLFAASSAPDTDFTAMVLDVHPNGFAQRLTDGMVRARFREGRKRAPALEPDTVYAFEIDLWTTSHVFFAGHRIRLQVASSAFPKYDRNLNTGLSLVDSAETCIAEQTVHHGGQWTSRLELPIISG
jgi:uncharacterized protein